jgi:hypothetical protein
MAVDFEGSVYVTGVQYNEARNGTELADFLTVKFDSEGGREWSRLYRAGDFLHDEPTKLALDREGNVVVAGLSSHSDTISLSYDISLVKYTPFGTQLWALTHGTADATEWTVDMKVDRLGDIVVWGYSSGPLGVGGSVLKFLRDGTFLWEQGLPEQSAAPMELIPSALALDQANNIYVVGLRRDFTAQFPVALSTAKFNPMGGLVWSANYNADSMNWGNEFSAGVHVDAAGRVTATGSINGPNRDYVLVQYDQPASVEAPSILAQPQDALVKLGERVVFSVTASKALRYQWQFNGHDIADATNTTLVLPAAGPAEEGYYAVLVMNNLYCVSSETVRLALDVPQPIIVEHALRDGQFLCTVVVTPGFYYRLEASQDLFAWRSVGMVEALGRVINFSDTNIPQTRRFYRVAQQK